MQNNRYNRNPDGFWKKEPGETRTRSPGHGRKLKNASSAKTAAGFKFRQEKADYVLNDKDAKELLERRKSHQKAARRTWINTRAAHDAVEKANEDDNAGTEALNRGTETAETGVKVAGDHFYGRKLKAQQAERVSVDGGKGKARGAEAG